MTAKPPTESQLMKAFKVLANQKKPENTSFRYFSGVKTVDPVEYVMIPKALYDEWVSADDAALDWADANARWFDISTAPLNGGSSAKFQVLYDGGHFEDAWSYAGKIWVADQDGCDCQVSLGDATHWRPIINPPLGQLPAPLEALGAVLRRVKNV